MAVFDCWSTTFSAIEILRRHYLTIHNSCSLSSTVIVEEKLRYCWEWACRPLLRYRTTSISSCWLVDKYNWKIWASRKGYCMERLQKWLSSSSRRLGMSLRGPVHWDPACRDSAVYVLQSSCHPVPDFIAACRWLCTTKASRNAFRVWNTASSAWCCARYSKGLISISWSAYLFSLVLDFGEFQQVWLDQLALHPPQEMNGAGELRPTERRSFSGICSSSGALY